MFLEIHQAFRVKDRVVFYTSKNVTLVRIKDFSHLRNELPAAGAHFTTLNNFQRRYPANISKPFASILHDMKIWNTNILHEAQVKDKHSPSLKVCIKPETDWMEDMWLAWWQQASRSPNVSSFSQQTVGWALNSFHMFRFKQDVFPVSTQTWHFVWNMWSRVQTVARCVYGALKFSKKRSKSSTKRRLVRLRGFEFGVAWSRTRCLSYCFDCWDGEELENIRKEAQDEYVAERLREHAVQQKQIKFGYITGRISYEKILGLALKQHLHKILNLLVAARGVNQMTSTSGPILSNSAGWDGEKTGLRQQALGDRMHYELEQVGSALGVFASCVSAAPVLELQSYSSH